MKIVAKLADGRICELLRHNVSVAFDPRPGWSLVARPVDGSPMGIHPQTLWWVQSTQISWILEM